MQKNPQRKVSYYIYIMLMSSKNKRADTIKGIKEGPDDILTEHYPESLDRSFERLIFDVKEFMGQDGFSDEISIIGFKWRGSRVN